MKYEFTVESETGNRIDYKVKNELGQWIKYCLMENSLQKPQLYRCSKDGEASHEVKVKPQVLLTKFERPLYGPALQLFNDYYELLMFNKWLKDGHDTHMSFNDFVRINAVSSSSNQED